MHVETVKLREIRPLVDIIHILLASRAEVSYSTRALRALRAIRKYVVLGLAPSGTYDISLARARAIYCSAREVVWIYIYIIYIIYILVDVFVLRTSQSRAYSNFI